MRVKKGGGALDLAMHVLGVSFVEAAPPSNAERVVEGRCNNGMCCPLDAMHLEQLPLSGAHAIDADHCLRATQAAGTVTQSSVVRRICEMSLR